MDAGVGGRTQGCPLKPDLTSRSSDSSAFSQRAKLGGPARGSGGGAVASAGAALGSSGAFPCEDCGRAFPVLAQLLGHQQRAHGLSKPHRCCTCGRRFALLSSLQVHQRVHWGALDCQICGESFPSAPSLAAHLLLLHANPEDPQNLPAESRRAGRARLAQGVRPRLQPPRRERRYRPGGERLSGPQWRHTDEGPYACARCGQAFSEKAVLLWHQQAGCGAGGRRQRKRTVNPESEAVTETVAPTMSTPQATPSPIALPPPPPDSSPLHGSASVSPSAAAVAFLPPPLTPAPSLSPPAAPTPHQAPATGFHQCSCCPKQFKTSSGLSSHLRQSHAPVPKKEKERKTSGYWLLQEVGERGTYPCRSCPQVFYTPSSLSRHKCRELGSKRAASKKERVLSKVQPQREGLYSCQHCQGAFASSRGLREHVTLRHGVVRSEGEGKREDGKASKTCAQCPKGFRNPLSIFQHRTRECRQQLGLCKEEVLETKKEEKEVQEQRTAKPERTTKTCATTKRFPCRSCDQVFQHASALYQHREQHQRKRGKSVSSRAEKRVKEGKRRKEEEVEVAVAKKRKSFPCFYCSKTFLHPASRYTHSRVHHPQQQERAKQCWEARTCLTCRTPFSNRSLLLQHCTIGGCKPRVQLPGVEDQLFACDLCPKAYRHLPNLYMHRKIHLNPPKKSGIRRGEGEEVKGKKGEEETLNEEKWGSEETKAEEEKEEKEEIHLLLSQRSSEQSPAPAQEPHRLGKGSGGRGGLLLCSVCSLGVGVSRGMPRRPRLQREEEEEKKRREERGFGAGCVDRRRLFHCLVCRRTFCMLGVFLKHCEKHLSQRRGHQVNSGSETESCDSMDDVYKDLDEDI
ncbi:replication initiator 1 isoform X2 [Amia ocellicauda]